MGRRLIEELSQLTPVVIDFEYTTPTGAAPEPIEVALQALRVGEGRVEPASRWEALMRPPNHAALTAFDSHQTGITGAMLAEQPAAATVLAELDRHFSAGAYVLVAHNAPAEARILYDYREHCPNLARIDLIDTVRMARDLYPALPRHSLDDLLIHLKIPARHNRHRAMPDVQATVELFTRLLADNTRWSDLRQLRAVAGCTAKATQPEQGALFP